MTAGNLRLDITLDYFNAILTLKHYSRLRDQGAKAACTELIGLRLMKAVIDTDLTKCSQGCKAEVFKMFSSSLSFLSVFSHPPMVPEGCILKTYAAVERTLLNKRCWKMLLKIDWLYYVSRTSSAAFAIVPQQRPGVGGNGLWVELLPSPPPSSSLAEPCWRNEEMKAKTIWKLRVNLHASTPNYILFLTTQNSSHMGPGSGMGP